MKKRTVYIAVGMLAVLVGLSVYIGKEKSGVQKKPVLIGSNIKQPNDLTLLTMDMRPLSECLNDEECYFYAFSIHLNKPKDIVVYDDNIDSVSASVEGEWTSVDLIDQNGVKVEKRVRIVNAMTPTQCINDKECVWFAFYNLVARNVMGQNTEKSINKWGSSLEYAIAPKEIGGYKKYREESLKVLESIKPYFPHEIRENHTFLYLVWLSDDIERDVSYKYEKFFNSAFDGVDLVGASLKNSQLKGKRTCIAIPVHNKETGLIDGAVSLVRVDKGLRGNCLNKSLHNSLGFPAGLMSFPFSIHNKFGDENKMRKANRMTSLDRFLITLLYHNDIKAGMSTDPNILRPVFDTAYPKAVKVYNDIKRKGEK